MSTKFAEAKIKRQAQEVRDMAKEEGGVPHDVAIITPRVTAHIIAEPGQDASITVERLLRAVVNGDFDLKLEATEYA